GCQQFLRHISCSQHPSTFGAIFYFDSWIHSYFSLHRKYKKAVGYASLKLFFTKYSKPIRSGSSTNRFGRLFQIGILANAPIAICHKDKLPMIDLIEINLPFVHHIPIDSKIGVNLLQLGDTGFRVQPMASSLLGLEGTDAEQGV